MEDNMDQDLCYEDTQKGRYLTFFLGKETYGIEIKYVTEIIRIQDITPIPELPEYVKGIINLRGKIIPVMDMRLRFKKEVIAYHDRTCIIIVEIHDMFIGLIVDSVSEVIFIPEEELSDPPKLQSGDNKYIKKLGKSCNEIKLLLDCEKLLTDKVYEEINTLTGM